MSKEKSSGEPPKKTDLDVIIAGVVISALTLAAGPVLAPYYGLAVDLAFFQTPLVIVSLLWVMVFQIMGSRASRREIYEARRSTDDQIVAYQATSSAHIHEVRASTTQEIAAFQEHIGRVVTSLEENMSALMNVNQNLVRVSSDMGIVAEDVKKREASLPQLEVAFDDVETEVREVLFHLDRGDEKRSCSTTYLRYGEERTLALSIKNRGAALAIHPRLSLSIPKVVEVKGGPPIRITKRPNGTAVLIEGEPIMGGGDFSVQYSLSFVLVANLAEGTFVPIEYLLQAENIALRKDYLAVGVRQRPPG